MTATQTWEHRLYQSGTQTVTNVDDPHSPWLYVCMTNPVDIDDCRNRFQMTEDLTAWLNGGPRPAWMDDMERVKEDELIGMDGASIRATGPMYDENPPCLSWRERDDDAAKNARARLIDRLWFNQV